MVKARMDQGDTMEGFMNCGYGRVGYEGLGGMSDSWNIKP